MRKLKIPSMKPINRRRMVTEYLTYEVDIELVPEYKERISSVLGVATSSIHSIKLFNVTKSKIRKTNLYNYKVVYLAYIPNDYKVGVITRLIHRWIWSIDRIFREKVI